MNALATRVALQELLAIDPPRLGGFGTRTRDAFEKLALADPLSDWPPKPNAAAETVSSISRKIVAAAQQFLGLTERKSNSEWDDPTTPGKDAAGDQLRALMLNTGWQPGWAYCIAFCEAVWRIGYQDRHELADIKLLITPSVMSTFENFEKLGRISRDPKPGAIFLKQHGSSWQGHAGIVLSVVSGRVLTIEANTSAQAGTPESEREGDGVFAKHWPLDFTKSSGLWLRGFLNPFVK